MRFPHIDTTHKQKHSHGTHSTRHRSNGTGHWECLVIIHIAHQPACRKLVSLCVLAFLTEGTTIKLCAQKRAQAQQNEAQQKEMRKQRPLTTQATPQNIKRTHLNPDFLVASGMPLVPTSMTAAPGLSHEPFTILGCPHAAITMSASCTTDAMSCVYEGVRM